VSVNKVYDIYNISFMLCVKSLKEITFF